MVSPAPACRARIKAVKTGPARDEGLSLPRDLAGCPELFQEGLCLLARDFAGGVGVAQGLDGLGEFVDALILVGQVIWCGWLVCPGLILALLGSQEGDGHLSVGLATSRATTVGSGLGPLVVRMAMTTLTAMPSIPTAVSKLPISPRVSSGICIFSSPYCVLRVYLGALGPGAGNGYLRVQPAMKASVPPLAAWVSGPPRPVRLVIRVWRGLASNL